MAPPDIEVAGADAAARQLHLFGTAQATEPRRDVRQPHRGGAMAAAVDLLRRVSRARESAPTASSFAVTVAATSPLGESPVALPAAASASQHRRSTTLFERQPVAPEANAEPALAAGSGSTTAGAAAAERDSEDAAAHDLEHAPPAETQRRAEGAAAAPGETVTSSRRPGAAAARPSSEETPTTAEAVRTVEETGTAAAAPAEEARAETPAAGGDGRSACEVDCVYVGQDCFFLELPDGTLACVAGLENLPAAAPAAADVGDTQAGAAAEEQMTLARLQCHNCLQLLEFDSRAYFVQCSSCLTLNAVQNQANSLRGGRAMIVICGRCSTRNISCLGSVYVECWQCHTVCQVDYPTPAAAAGLVSEQGTSAAASAAAAAAGEIAMPAVRLQPFGRRRGGFFASSASRRRLGRRSPTGLTHLQRRLRSGLWRPDEEESSVSAVAGREDRGPRVSTAVELPPALSSRGRGRSLVARHSFNPLPPRNIRIHVGGAPGNANSSTNNYREGTPPDSTTVVATQTSCSTYPQQTRQQRQRLRWRTRPETAPSRREPAGQSDAGISGHRSLSVLFRLPFRRNYSTADGRADTAAAVPRGFTGGEAGDTGGSREEFKQAAQSGRARRRDRRMPEQGFTGRSDSGNPAGRESAEDASPGNAAAAVGRRRVHGTQATEPHQDGTTAELLPGGAPVGNRRERETVEEIEEDRRTLNGRADRGRIFSENESGGSGETPIGPSTRSCCLRTQIQREEEKQQSTFL